MQKVLLILFIGFLGLLVFCMYGFAQIEKPENISNQDLLIKNEVETAASMLQAIYVKYQAGEMTLENAKKLGADLLRELRYSGEGYFWADTKDGVNVVHARKGIEGRNRIEDKDSKGTYYIKDFIAKAKQGGGYSEYWYPKMGQTVEQQKRAYVMLFEPFGWIVGTGYYLEK